MEEYMYFVSRVHELTAPETGRYAISLGKVERPARFGLGFFKNQVLLWPNERSLHVEFPLASPKGQGDAFLVDVKKSDGVQRLSDVVSEEGEWFGRWVARYRIHPRGFMEVGAKNPSERSCRESLLIEVR